MRRTADRRFSPNGADFGAFRPGQEHCRDCQGIDRRRQRPGLQQNARDRGSGDPPGEKGRATIVSYLNTPQAGAPTTPIGPLVRRWAPLIGFLAGLLVLTLIGAVA